MSHKLHVENLDQEPKEFNKDVKAHSLKAKNVTKGSGVVANADLHGKKKHLHSWIDTGYEDPEDRKAMKSQVMKEHEHPYWKKK